MFDALGREVARLLDGPTASREITWDATEASPGVYLVRLDMAGAATEAVRVVRR